MMLCKREFDMYPGLGTGMGERTTRGGLAFFSEALQAGRGHSGGGAGKRVSVNSVLFLARREGDGLQLTWQREDGVEGRKERPLEWSCKE